MCARHDNTNMRVLPRVAGPDDCQLWEREFVSEAIRRKNQGLEYEVFSGLLRRRDEECKCERKKVILAGALAAQSN